MRTHDLNEWDPLQQSITIETDLAGEMQRQTIRNILRSYTGFFDLFSELIQNALDACDERLELGEENYQPQLWIHIDIANQEVSIVDNGIGLREDKLKLFLQPNMTFKKSGKTRGNKGVGVTYLAYGFNSVMVATRVPGFHYAGMLEYGRTWAEDTDNAEPKPRMRSVTFNEEPFESIDQGTFFRIRLDGKNIRPKDLSWLQASNAEQWDAVLRVKTPLGGLYRFSEITHTTVCHLYVTDEGGNQTEKHIQDCEYFYPHEIPGIKTVSFGDLLSQRKKALEQGRQPKSLQHLYGLHGLYDIFSAEEILEEKSEIRPRLTERQRELMQAHKPDLYVFFGWSPQLWDHFNDIVLKLRQKGRILKGGLQLATKNMSQGELLVIPLTKSIGYQNQTHIIVHFRDADPDMGRKGFQPELVDLAESLSTASVTAFKKYVEHLRKDTGEPHIAADAQRHIWIRAQENYQENNPLSVTGAGLYAPEEVIPIISVPSLEQDVIALFHQLLAAGVIRGFRILATNGHEMYDGVFKIQITEPVSKFIYSEKTNPLGIPADNIQMINTEPKILEYKYNVDALINDFDNDDKFENHVNLVIAWTVGERWKERYDVVPLLYDEYIHRRNFHGFTHQFLDNRSGETRFYGIILDELIEYLRDAVGLQDKLRARYLD